MSARLIGDLLVSAINQAANVLASVARALLELGKAVADLVGWLVGKAADVGQQTGADAGATRAVPSRRF